MGYRTNDSEYFRRAASVLRVLRYLTLLVLIFTIVLSILFYRKEITMENLQYLFKYIDFDPPSADASAERSITFQADANTEFAMLRNDIALVSKRNFGLYDFSGRKLMNYDTIYTNPVAISSAKNVLVFDLGGKDLSIYNSFSQVLAKEYEFGVKDAVIKDNGSFAVLTAEKNYRSGMIVYNSAFEDIFTYMSRERYLTGIDISQDAKAAVCVSLLAKDGDYSAAVTLFDTGKEEVKKEVSLGNAFPMEAAFLKDRLFVLTDQALLFFDGDLEGQVSIPLPKNGVKRCVTHGGLVAVTSETVLAGNASQVLVYDNQGSLVLTEEIKGEITDLAVSDDYIYVLTPQVLYCIGIQRSEGQDAQAEVEKTQTIRKDTMPEAVRVFGPSANQYVLVSYHGAVSFRTDQPDQQATGENSGSGGD